MSCNKDVRIYVRIQNKDGKVCGHWWLHRLCPILPSQSASEERRSSVRSWRRPAGSWRETPRTSMTRSPSCRLRSLSSRCSWPRKRRSFRLPWPGESRSISQWPGGQSQRFLLASFCGSWCIFGGEACALLSWSWKPFTARHFLFTKGTFPVTCSFVCNPQKGIQPPTILSFL